MSADNSIEEDYVVRSNFVRGIVHRSVASIHESSKLTKRPPKRIVQFWDNLGLLPEDVKECMDTWRTVEEKGFERLIFDKYRARDFIYQKLDSKHLRAYDKCYHPAMQSDYFRLCYILVEGGFYIDADDVYNGSQIQHLFDDDRLKIQPLCYDTATSMMVPPAIFTQPGANEESWIFYFNNNPLIACSGHLIIKCALAQATVSLENGVANNLLEIQSTTGPGNLTKTIFEAIAQNGEMEQTILVLCNWEDISKSKWELSYRADARNWRLSNCQGFQA